MQNITAAVIGIIYKSNICDLTLDYAEWGARWRSWLRHYATNWQVAGSIPNGVTGIF